MKRSQATVLIAACLALETACVTPLHLVPGADQVRMTGNAAALANCKPAGEVHVPRDPVTHTVSIAEAQRHFRNQVISLGGNAGLVTSGLVSIPNDGIAYQCPDSLASTPAAKTIPPAAPTSPVAPAAPAPATPSPPTPPAATAALTPPPAAPPAAAAPPPASEVTRPALTPPPVPTAVATPAATPAPPAATATPAAMVTPTVTPSPSAAAATAGAGEPAPAEGIRPGHTTYHTLEVQGINIFYREAGNPSLPTLILLHGAGSSSFEFRELIPQLATDFHVIAPDYPGHGFSDAPPAARYRYTFDHLAQHIDAFLNRFGVRHYMLYMHDDGGPIGMRIALAHPERVTGLIVQDANAYAEGLSSAWRAQLENQIKDGQAHKVAAAPASKEAPRSFEDKLKALKQAYEEGTRSPETLSADGYTFDAFLGSRPGRDELQKALADDYYSNLALYPQWQKWLKQAQPRTLVLWGQGDRIFSTSAAEAYKKDLPQARLVFFPTGHYLLEEFAPEAAQEILTSFAGVPAPKKRAK